MTINKYEMIKVIKPSTSVLDDDGVFIKVVKKIFANFGETNIKYFTSTQQFLLDYKQDQDVRLIVLDYILGDERGIDILKLINTHDDRYVNVVVISNQEGYSDSEARDLIIELFHNGLYRYINKSDENWAIKLENYYRDAYKDILEYETKKVEKENELLAKQDLIEALKEAQKIK